MIDFNEVNCFIDSKNTGFGRCVAKLGKLEYDAMVAPSTRIALSDLADVQGFFTDLFINDSRVLRGYKLGKWVTVEDGSTDPVREGFDGGVDTTLYDGASILSRRIIAGGLCGHLGLRKFNGTQDQFAGFQVFKSLDSSSALYYIVGKKVKAADGSIEMAPVTYDDIWAPARKIATGSAGETYMLRTVMGDVSQVNENIILLPIDFDFGSLPAIMDVEITSVTKSTTGVFDMAAVIACGNSNLTTVYPQLADPDAVVVISNLGATVPITGVTIVNGKLRVALDTSDAAYTAGTTFSFAIAPPSVTSDTPFNVEWIESNTVSGIAK